MSKKLTDFNPTQAFLRTPHPPPPPPVAGSNGISSSLEWRMHGVFFRDQIGTQTPSNAWREEHLHGQIKSSSTCCSPC